MERTMKLQDVILKAMAKKISWMEAAEIVGVTDRTMRPIYRRPARLGTLPRSPYLASVFDSC